MICPSCNKNTIEETSIVCGLCGGTKGVNTVLTDVLVSYRKRIELLETKFQLWEDARKKC